MPSRPCPNVAGPRATVAEVGYSASQGANWSTYLKYRPLYPSSFYTRIFSYHAAKDITTWTTAHDVGSGCGIVASTLSSKFCTTIVSDPNDGYVALARRTLVEESKIPDSKFRFLQEKAEHSSVPTSSVDLVTICAAIHWTDTDASIRDFARQLRPGGTLAIAHYSRPWIVGNERASRAWNSIWDEWITRIQGEAFDRAFWIVQSAYETLAFPRSDWTQVKRLYINAEGSRKTFLVSLNDDRIGVDRVGAREEKIWIEDDEGWCEWRDIAFFKGYLSTWLPPIPEKDLQSLWDELDLALEGREVKIRTPVVLIVATRRKSSLLRRVMAKVRMRVRRGGLLCGLP